LLVLLPGENLSLGSAPGKTGTPTAQTVGSSVAVQVYVLDKNYNLVAGAAPSTVSLSSSDPYASVPSGDLTFTGGQAQANVTFQTAGTQTVTATDSTAALTSGSSSVTVNPGPADYLISYPPINTPAHGHPPVVATGFTITQTLGEPFAVTVEAEDSYFNLVPTVTDTVKLTSSDPNAMCQPAPNVAYQALPVDVSLVGGIATFNVIFNTPGTGSQTLDVSDVSESLTAIALGPIPVVAPAAPTANNQAISVSENSPGVPLLLSGSDPNTPPFPLTYTVLAPPPAGSLTGTPPNLSYTPLAGSTTADSFQFEVYNGYVYSAPATVSINIVPTGQPLSASTPISGGATGTVNLPPGPGQGGLTATFNNTAASGTGAVTVTAQTYSGNPTTSPTEFGLNSTYFDLEAPGATASDSLTAYFYYPFSFFGPPLLEYYSANPPSACTGTSPDWYPVLENASDCSSTPPLAFPVYLDGVPYYQYTVTFTAGSQPAITALTGTIFVLGSASAPTITCPEDIQVNQDTGQCGALVAFAPAVTGFPTPILIIQLQDGTAIASPYQFPVGVSTVYCTAANGIGSQNCNFTVTVLDTNPPVAGSFAIAPVEGTSESVPVSKILSVDSSPSGGPLSIQSVTSPTANNGVVTLGGGLLTYTPAVNYVGADIINYVLSDGCGTVPGAVSVTVVSANAPSQNGLTIQVSDGNAILQFHGIPGQAYYIQVAPTLTGPWTDLPGTPVTANGLGLIAYTVILPASPSYYRTSINP
jgi:hypothetical protein